MRYTITKEVKMSVKQGALAVLKDFIDQLDRNDCEKEADFAEIFETADIFDTDELRDDYDVDEFYNSDTFSEYCDRVSVKLIDKLNEVLEELIAEADED